MKHDNSASLGSPSRLSLHWESGLKLVEEQETTSTTKSLPSLGEWIETPLVLGEPIWIESLPSLGEWIETGIYARMS